MQNKTKGKTGKQAQIPVSEWLSCASFYLKPCSQTIATCQRNIFIHNYVLWHLWYCWLTFENGQIWTNDTWHVAAISCVNWYVAIVWPGLIIELTHVVWTTSMCVLIYNGIDITGTFEFGLLNCQKICYISVWFNKTTPLWWMTSSLNWHCYCHYNDHVHNI